MANIEENSDELRVLPADAAKQLGISKTTLLRYADTGVIKVGKDAKGNRYFLQEDLDAFREARSGDSTLAVFTAQQSELTSTALDHVRKTLDMVHEPARALIAILKDEVAALRTRNQFLEGRVDDMTKAWQEALNDQHARDLAAKELDAALKRKDDLIELLKMTAKPLMAQLMATVAGSDTRSQAMADFLGKVDQDKIKALLGLPFLDEEEKTSLKTMLKAFGIELDLTEVEASGEEAPNAT